MTKFRDGARSIEPGRIYGRDKGWVMVRTAKRIFVDLPILMLGMLLLYALVHYLRWLV